MGFLRCFVWCALCAVVVDFFIRQFFVFSFIQINFVVPSGFRHNLFYIYCFWCKIFWCRCETTAKMPCNNKLDYVQSTARTAPVQQQRHTCTTDWVSSALTKQNITNRTTCALWCVCVLYLLKSNRWWVANTSWVNMKYNIVLGLKIYFEFLHVMRWWWTKGKMKKEKKKRKEKSRRDRKRERREKKM